jgi:hypothetical protein
MDQQTSSTKTMSEAKTTTGSFVDSSVESKEVFLEGGSGSICSDDSYLMALGKKPELKRVYNFWTRKLWSSKLPCLQLLTLPTSMRLSSRHLQQLELRSRSLWHRLRHWRTSLIDLRIVGRPLASLKTITNSFLAVLSLQLDKPC